MFHGHWLVYDHAGPGNLAYRAFLDEHIKHNYCYNKEDLTLGY